MRYLLPYALATATVVGSLGANQELTWEPASKARAFWQPVSATQARSLGPPRFRVKHYRVWKLDLAGLQKVLATAPADQTGPLLQLPLPDGSLVPFRMRTTQVMAPALAAKYPNLRTYAGQETTQPANDARLETTATEVRAMVNRNGHTYFIEPYRPHDHRYYICFDKAELPASRTAEFESPSK